MRPLCGRRLSQVIDGRRRGVVFRKHSLLSGPIALDPFSGAFFCAVHGQVGMTDQGRPVLAILGVDGDPDAGRHPPVLPRPLLPGPLIPLSVLSHGRNR